MAQDEQAIRRRIVTSVIRRAARNNQGDVRTVSDTTAAEEIEHVAEDTSSPAEGFAWGLMTHFLAFAAGAAGAWLWLYVHNPEPVPVAHRAVVAVASPPAVAPVAAENLPPDPLVNVDQEISDLLFRWMEAWTQRDADAYLAFYSQEFRPADGSSRERWAAGRRNNLRSKAGPIRLSIHDLVIVPSGASEVNAVFLQDYASGSYHEAKRPKTMQLRREESGWKIIRETQQMDGPRDEQP